MINQRRSEYKGNQVKALLVFYLSFCEVNLFQKVCKSSKHTILTAEQVCPAVIGVAVEFCCSIGCTLYLWGK